MVIRVLVVDDDPSVAPFIRNGLPPEEFLVLDRERESGILGAIASVSPDVLILDWALSKRFGSKLCRQVRSVSETRNLSVIMLTGINKASIKTEALDSGADDCVAKPLHPDELAARIRAVLRSRRSELRGRTSRI